MGRLSFGAYVFIGVVGCGDNRTPQPDAATAPHHPPDVAAPDLASKPCNGVFDFSVAEHIDSTIMMQPVSMHLIDLDGDENLDLVTVGRGPEQVGGVAVTRRGLGGGAFAEDATTYALEVSPFLPGEGGRMDLYRTTLRADVDGDGRQDIVLTGYPGILTLLDPGDGSLVPTPPSNGSIGATVMVTDLDYDGIPDVVTRVGLSLYDDNAVYYQRGLGHGAFGEAVMITSARDVYNVTALDVDGDGNRDLVVQTTDTEVLFGHGDGTFEPPRSLFSQPAGGAPTAHDVTGDGRLDLVGEFGGPGGAMGGVAVNRGDGTFTFESSSDGNSHSSGGYPIFGDLDGDGHVDMVFAQDAYASNGGGVTVYLGHGDGTFAPSLTYATGFAGNMMQAGHDIDLGDVDGDGILDIVTNDDGGGAYILHGRCTTH